MAGSGPSLALLVAEELQKLSAFDASASDSPLLVAFRYQPRKEEECQWIFRPQTAKCSIRRESNCTFFYAALPRSRYDCFRQIFNNTVETWVYFFLYWIYSFLHSKYEQYLVITGGSAWKRLTAMTRRTISSDVPGVAGDKIKIWHQVINRSAAGQHQPIGPDGQPQGRSE